VRDGLREVRDGRLRCLLRALLPTLRLLTTTTTKISSFNPALDTKYQQAWREQTRYQQPIPSQSPAITTMVPPADNAGVDPQYGLRIFMGVPVLHGVPRGYIPRLLVKVHGEPTMSDTRFAPSFIRTASREDILRRDLDCEIKGRKNLESHCVRLETQLAEERARNAEEETRAAKKLKLDTEHGHSQETDDVSLSLPPSADQSGDTIHKTTDDGISEQTVNDSFRLNELEPKQTSQNETGGTSQDATVTANENNAEKAVSGSHSPKQLDHTITELKKRLREAEEGTRRAEDGTRRAEEATQRAEEDARAAKRLKLDTEYRLTVEMNNTMKLRRLAQTWEPKLRPHLHGQPIIDPCSSEEWALFGWLEQTLDNVTKFYVSGAAASLVEDDLKSQFPFNKDPSPGPEPTPYDLRIGPIVLTNVLASGKSMPKWRGETPNTLPKIPNTGTITKDRNGNDLSKCKGNTNWSTGETALYLVNRAEPSLRWMLNPAGKPILRWDTPSRTRSRTLKSWQSLPKEAVFFKDVKNEDASVAQELKTKSSIGPAWTYYSLAFRHDGKCSIMPWANKTCECRTGQHSGNCRPHDFRLDWEDKTVRFPSDPIPKSITRGQN
jgi:hypothetical protein